MVDEGLDTVPLSVAGGNPFQGPTLGSHMLTKQVTWLGGGTEEDSSRVRKPKGMSATCLAVSGFMVMGFVSRLSLWPNNLTQGSFHAFCSAFYDQ